MKILVISSSPFKSGAEESLIQLISNVDNSAMELTLILSENKFNQTSPINNCRVINLPLIWFIKSYNPFYILKCIKSIIEVTLRLNKIIRNEKIDVIYSNTTKSHIYSLFVKLWSGKKLVWHVRDNIHNGLLKSILLKHSDRVICISNHIFKQFSVFSNCSIIYNGIDTLKFIPHVKIKEDIRKGLNLAPNTIIVVQIGQITKWKNHFDFIHCANIVLQTKANVHFLIIGDDQWGREKDYRQQIKNEIDRLELSDKISFIGHKNEIKEIYTQIDILVHPAIDEPFGRVIGEAMAMEKSVVAYDCGGPKEIIQNGVSGFLVEPDNYKLLAEKVLALIDDNTLRYKFGKMGRKIIQKNFNIEKYVKEMKQLFNSI